MTNTQRNWAVVAAFLLSFSAGGATGFAAGDCPPTVLKMPTPPPCEVSISVEPCICDVDITADPPPTCPDVKIIVEPEDPESPASVTGHPYRLDVVVRSDFEDRAGLAVVWNRFQKFRPGLGATYTQGHEIHATGRDWHQRSTKGPLLIDDGWRVEAVLAVGLWKANP